MRKIRNGAHPGSDPGNLLCEGGDVPFTPLTRYEVTKQEIFDLQLVATMLLYNVISLYTYNQTDFAKFKEIEVLSP